MAGLKGRLSLLQLVAGGVVMSMVAVCVYMYQIIDTLHREQQSMRLQIAELAGTTRGARQHTAPPSGPDPPVPRPGPLAGFMPRLGAGGGHPPGGARPRKLNAFTTGRASGDGCYEIHDVASPSYDVSTTGCSGHFCPDCFVTPATVSQAMRLTVESCSSAVGVRDQPRGGVWVYTFINTSPQPLEVTDNSGAPVVYKVPSLSFVQAYCASTLGTADRLMFPSTNLPTLIIDNGLTLLAGDLDASGSAGEIKTPQGANTLNGHVQIAGDRTFATGTGAVSLNGATTVADATPFTVGSPGNGGNTAMYGNVLIGSDDSVASFTYLDVYGSVAFHDDPASVQTFSTASGQIDLNGHIDVAAGKHLHMGGGAGVGTFKTGAGAVTLNGDTSIPGAQTFATGTGAVTINGDTTIKDGVTFTAGSAGLGGNVALYGNVLIGGSGDHESVSTTVYGDFAQHDDHDGATFNTFSTATGAVSLNGHVAVAPGKDLLMGDTGAGSLRTGTGDVLLNGDTVITGARTFDTGTGYVRLNGAVAVADSTSFSMGGPGTGGVAQFFGNVVIGGSPHGASTKLDVYGNVAFRNDGDGTKKTFQTASGDVTIFGDTTVAPHKFLHMHESGTGTFQTGTGPVTLNGPTTVAHGNAFTIGTYLHEIACDHAWNDPGDTICKATR